jgi:hypothetical protein
VANGYMIMNNEMKRIWKEVVMACFNPLTAPNYYRPEMQRLLG